MKKRLAVFGMATILLIVAAGAGIVSHAQSSHDPRIAHMIQQISENEIYNTTYVLQNFTTRYYGSSGNEEASAYLFDKLGNISGLTVEFQGGKLRNVIATLPGNDSSSSDIYMVGAHYDSINKANNSDAPGATDNAGGVAIVLELARIMSQYSFNHTIKFALWNEEEEGLKTSGSTNFAKNASANNLTIPLYVNYDSACYDPNNRLILDIMYNNQSRWAADMMTEHNKLYEIGFNLTYNVHTCKSDHSSFSDNGYNAVMTHAETHGPHHTPNDTIDKVSTLYAKKNAQLGMSVLARLAEVIPGG